MILTRENESIFTETGKLSIGDRIIAVDSDYAGLKGYIAEIRTGTDKETENNTIDVYCRFDIPQETEAVTLLEEHFSGLYGYPKTIDDLALYMVIMAPDMLRTVSVNVL